jgi:hypothetical protein
MPRRWHQIGGMEYPPMTVTRKPDRREEHEGNRKAIAQGMPDCFGEPVVTYSCAFFFCT